MTFNKALATVLVAILFIASIPAAASAQTARPPWQLPSEWPDRIVATIEKDPATSFSVTWRTDDTVGAAIAEIAPASAVARFDLAAETFHATTERVELESIGLGDDKRPILQNQGLMPVHYHSITFEGLKPDTLYAYRVRGAPGAWSAWKQIRTAPLDGPLSFIFFGDSQTGIRSHVTRTFDAALKAAPDARFALHGGDLVNTAMYDKEWAEWFEAVGQFHAVIPALPSPGNHDYFNFSSDDEDDDKLFIAPRRVSALWRPQFALPVIDDLPPELHETVYDVRYSKDVHVFSIDSSGVAFDKQMAWLSQALDKSDATWRIVYMHHPLFSFVGGREHPAHRERRDALQKLLKQKKVDLVLTGHRHSYQRGDIGEGVDRFQVGTPRSIDTVFLITATSTKRGESKVDGWQRFADEQKGGMSLKRHADNIPLFAVFDVDGRTIRVRSLDAVGGEYDAFTLTKDAAGRKTIIDGAPAMDPAKTFDNTAAYRAWDDLR